VCVAQRCLSHALEGAVSAQDQEPAQQLGHHACVEPVTTATSGDKRGSHSDTAQEPDYPLMAIDTKASGAPAEVGCNEVVANRTPLGSNGCNVQVSAAEQVQVCPPTRSLPAPHSPSGADSKGNLSCQASQDKRQIKAGMLAPTVHVRALAAGQYSPLTQPPSVLRGLVSPGSCSPVDAYFSPGPTSPTRSSPPPPFSLALAPGSCLSAAASSACPPSPPPAQLPGDAPPSDSPPAPPVQGNPASALSSFPPTQPALAAGGQASDMWRHQDGRRRSLPSLPLPVPHLPRVNHISSPGGLEQPCPCPCPCPCPSPRRLLGSHLMDLVGSSPSPGGANSSRVRHASSSPGGGLDHPVSLSSPRRLLGSVLMDMVGL
jgi:hypothetical protein